MIKKITLPPESGLNTYSYVYRINGWAMEYYVDPRTKQWIVIIFKCSLYENMVKGEKEFVTTVAYAKSKVSRAKAYKAAKKKALIWWFNQI